MSFFNTVSQRCNVTGVVLADFRSNAEIGTQESGADFSDQLFHCIAGVAVALASEVTIQASRVTGGVTTFMTERRVIGFTVAEALEFRHLHDVAVDAVKGAVAAVLNGDVRIGEKRLGGIEPLDLIGERRHGCIKMPGQSVDLLGVKDRQISILYHARNDSKVCISNYLTGGTWGWPKPSNWSRAGGYTPA